GLTLFRVSDTHVPRGLATGGIQSKHVRVAGATEQLAAGKRHTAVHPKATRGTRPAILPLQRAGRRVQRKSRVVGREVKHALNNDGTGLERRGFPSVVCARTPQATDIRLTNFHQRRETGSGEITAVDRPVARFVLGKPAL